MCLHLLVLQIEWDHAQRLAKRRIEREQAHKDATADMSDFSEGEKPDFTAGETGGMPRVSSVDFVAGWAEQSKEKKLYIVLIRYNKQDFIFQDCHGNMHS